MQAHGTSCKLLDLHAFWNILHAYWNILEHSACILEFSGTFCNFLHAFWTGNDIFIDMTASRGPGRGWMLVWWQPQGSGVPAPCPRCPGWGRGYWRIDPRPPVLSEGAVLRPRVIKEALGSEDKDKTNEVKTANRLQKELFNTWIQNVNRSTGQREIWDHWYYTICSPDPNLYVWCSMFTSHLPDIWEIWSLM